MKSHQIPIGIKYGRFITTGNYTYRNVGTGKYQFLFLEVQDTITGEISFRKKCNLERYLLKDEWRINTPRPMRKNNPRVYRIWKAIYARTNTNPTESAIKYQRKTYRERGITICKEWAESFEVFCIWALANGYEEHLTIERKNNRGNYEPSNCCWIPKGQQVLNRG